MPNLESSLDKTLKLFYEKKSITIEELGANQEISDIMKCVQILKKDQYVIRYWKPRVVDKYDITPSGEKFYEDGGYIAPRLYNDQVLRVAKDSNNLAWIAIGISIVALLVSILFGILQIPI